MAHASAETSPNQKFEEDSRQLARDLQEVYADVRDRRLLQRYYRDNPYVVLGTAAAVGYVVAGGLFTPFTRRLLRIGMKALVVPVAAAQVKGLREGQAGIGG